MIPGVFEEHITTTLNNIKTDIFLRTKYISKEHKILDIIEGNPVNPIINAGGNRTECKRLVKFVQKVSEQHYDGLFDIRQNTRSGCIIYAKVSDAYKSSVHQMHSTSETFRVSTSRFKS